MSQVDKTAVEQVLASYNDRYTGKNLVDSKIVKDIRINGGAVEVDLQFGYPCKGCLLYTSPSPRDKRQSRMPSSA